MQKFYLLKRLTLAPTFQDLMNDENWWEMHTMSLSSPGWQALITNKNKAKPTQAKTCLLPLWGWKRQSISFHFSQPHSHPTRTTVIHAGMGVSEPQVTPYGQRWTKPASPCADFQTFSNLTQQCESDLQRQGNRPTTWSRKSTITLGLSVDLKAGNSLWWGLKPFYWHLDVLVKSFLSVFIPAET